MNKDFFNWSFWDQITNIRCAVASTVLGTFFLLWAFFSDYWLENWGDIKFTKFTNLGLWYICMKDMHDPLYLYDIVFDGCRWIPNEDLWMLRQQLISPAFFVWVQVLFTFSTLFAFVALILVASFFFCCQSVSEDTMLKWITGFNVASAFFGLLSVIVFGANGDSRNWMPDPEHNFLGYAYWFANFGVFFISLAGLLTFLESRQVRRRERKQHEANVFTLQEQRTYHAKV